MTLSVFYLILSFIIQTPSFEGEWVTIVRIKKEDSLKLNLGLYTNVENILLYSNMFFNNYTDNLINKYPKYKSLMNPDLTLKFYNVEDALEQCDNLTFDF